MDRLVFLLLICAVGGGMTCTNDEISKLSNCISPYAVSFQTGLGTTGVCNQTKAAVYCSNYTSIVNCVNGLNVNNTGCAAHIVMDINTNLNNTCKVSDFRTVCPTAPAINETPFTTSVSPTAPSNTTVSPTAPSTTTVSPTTEKASGRSDILKPEITLFLFVLSLVLFNKQFP